MIFRDARRLGDIGKGAVAVVVKERMEAGREAARTAVHPHVPEHAVLVLSGLRRAVRIEIEVVGDEQVEPAVAVVVDPGAARAPMRPILADAGFLGHIGERAVPVVVVQHVLAPVGDEQVFEAVVVVVADADAVGPAGTNQPGLRRDIGESAVAIVLVEAVGGAFRSGFEARAAENEDVEPAVVIVVARRRSRSPSFRRCSPCGRRRRRS